MKKIKSVKKNGIPFREGLQPGMWISTFPRGETKVFECVTEDTILNCSLFEVGYENSEETDIQELKDALREALTLVCKLAVKLDNNSTT